MRNKARAWWGGALGFALGGFFDGILLHQILQWHHLLSLVPGVDSLRLQVLWDGYFHALMYVIATAALWGLLRNRSDERPGQRASLLGVALMGFGLWHIVDGVLSHWIMGIHRIRLDSANPLMWDLIWFMAFGVVPLLLGWLALRRTAGRPDASAAQPGILALAAVTMVAAIWAAQPPTAQRFTTVVFAPTVSPARAVDAVKAEGGSVMWSDASMGVLVIDLSEDRRLNFYRHGALLVSGSGAPGGCFNWSDA